MYLQLLASGSCQEYGASVYHVRVVPAIRNGEITRLSGLLKSEVFSICSLHSYFALIHVHVGIHFAGKLHASSQASFCPRVQSMYHPHDINL